MPLATATITGDLTNLVGDGFDPKEALAWVTTSAENDMVIDTDAKKIRLGSGPIAINPDGTIAFAIWVPGVGSNPPTWQTTIRVTYIDRRERKNVEFGPYTITASADLSELIREQAVTATYVSKVTALIDGKVAVAQAAATAAALSAAQAATAVGSGSGGGSLGEHINSPTPHPAYDTDGPSFSLLYQNAKV